MRNTCAAVLLVLVPGMAAAQQPPPPAASPWYVTVSGGAAFAANSTYTTNVAGLGVNADVSWSTGYGFLAGPGYRVLDWLRVEGELGYLNIPTNSASATLSNGTLFPRTRVDATLRGFAIFANGVLDWRASAMFVPYAGAGLGLVHYFSSDVGVPGVTVDRARSATNFALQVKAGLGVTLTPNIVLAPEYRFIWIDRSSNGLGSVSIHWIGASLRYHF
jgi:opacity protein-like surface antigen